MAINFDGDPCKPIFLKVKITNLRGGYNVNLLLGTVEHELVRQKPDEEIEESSVLDLGQYCTGFEDTEIEEEGEEEETTSSELSSTPSTYQPLPDDSTKLDDTGDSYGYGPILACIVLALVLIGVILGVLFLIRRRRSYMNGNVELIQRTDWLETDSIPINEDKYVEFNKENNELKNIYKITVLNQEADH